MRGDADVALSDPFWAPTDRGPEDIVTATIALDVVPAAASALVAPQLGFAMDLVTSSVLVMRVVATNPAATDVATTVTFALPRGATASNRSPVAGAIA